jgi:hypothetical protein
MKKDLKYYQKLAANRGGQLVSSTFNGTRKYHRWQCELGHPIWRAKPSNIEGNRSKLGTWCPVCSKRVSYAESLTRLYLEAMTGKSFSDPAPEELRAALSLDGYNSELGIAFEHQGRQHYEYTPYLHGGKFEKFLRQIENDKEKLDACLDADVNLIEIPEVGFYMKLSELRPFLENKLAELGVEFQHDVRPKISSIYRASIEDQIVDTLERVFERGDTPLPEFHYFTSKESEFHIDCSGCDGSYKQSRDLILRSETGCSSCSYGARGRGLASEFNEVFPLLKKAGLSFLDPELEKSLYLTHHSPLCVMCNLCGYVFKTNVNRLSAGKSCSKCGRDRAARKRLKLYALYKNGKRAEEILGIQGLSSRFGVAKKTIHKWIKQGKATANGYVIRGPD